MLERISGVHAVNVKTLGFSLFSPHQMAQQRTSIDKKARGTRRKFRRLADALMGMGVGKAGRGATGGLAGSLAGSMESVSDSTDEDDVNETIEEGNDEAGGDHATNLPTSLKSIVGMVSRRRSMDQAIPAAAAHHARAASHAVPAMPHDHNITSDLLRDLLDRFYVMEDVYGPVTAAGFFFFFLF